MNKIESSKSFHKKLLLRSLEKRKERSLAALFFVFVFLLLVPLQAREIVLTQVFPFVVRVLVGLDGQRYLAFIEQGFDEDVVSV